jgi:gamma-glutamyltranspeptidase
MTLVRAFDLGRDPAEAVAAPLWLVGGMSPLRGAPWIEAEGWVPEPVRTDLAAAGFQVRTLEDLDRAVGHAMLLRIDEGTLIAGSDPRADGGARAAS